AQWHVLAAGFDTRELRKFNKKWSVKLRPIQGRTSVWDNGMSGETSPLIELRYERCAPPTWKLRFRLGECVVEYSKPAAEWNIVGKNVFTCVSSSGLAATGRVPASMEVEPA